MNMATQTPRTEDQSIEDEIVRKGKTAPRVTPADIEASIASEHYFTAANGVCGGYMAYRHSGKQEGEQVPVEMLDLPVSLALLTFCVLVLKNGFTATGESACASPENFDPEIGCKIAKQNATAKIWALEGYLLKQRLSEGAV